MKQWVPWVAVAALVVPACGGDDTSDSSTVASSTTTPTMSTTTAPTATVPTTTAPDSVLLSDADIESVVGDDVGWSSQVLEPGSGSPSGLGAPCEDVALNPAIAQRLAYETGLDASREDGNASLVEFVIVGDDAERLATDLDIYLGAVDACESTSPTTPGMLPTRLDLPGIGDQRWAEVGVCPGWSPDSRRWTALVRLDTRAMLMQMCEQPVMAGTELLVTDDEFVSLVDAAVARMGG